jgi:hypothetical protein
MNRKGVNNAIIKVLGLYILFCSFSCTPEIEEQKKDKLTDYNYLPLQPLGYEWKWNQVNYSGVYWGPRHCLERGWERSAHEGPSIIFTEIKFPSINFPKIKVAIKPDSILSDTLKIPSIISDSAVTTRDSLRIQD